MAELAVEAAVLAALVLEAELAVEVKEVAAVPAVEAAALVPEAELAVEVKEVVPVLGLEAEPAVEVKEMVQDLDPKAALVLEAAKVALAEVALVNLAARALAEAQERVPRTVPPQNN